MEDGSTPTTTQVSISCDNGSFSWVFCQEYIINKVSFWVCFSRNVIFQIDILGIGGVTEAVREISLDNKVNMMDHLRFVIEP